MAPLAPSASAEQVSLAVPKPGERFYLLPDKAGTTLPQELTTFLGTNDPDALQTTTVTVSDVLSDVTGRPQFVCRDGQALLSLALFNKYFTQERVLKPDEILSPGRQCANLSPLALHELMRTAVQALELPASSGALSLNPLESLDGLRAGARIFYQILDCCGDYYDTGRGVRYVPPHATLGARGASQVLAKGQETVSIDVEGTPTLITPDSYVTDISQADRVLSCVRKRGLDHSRKFFTLYPDRRSAQQPTPIPASYEDLLSRPEQYLQHLPLPALIRLFFSIKIQDGFYTTTHCYSGGEVRWPVKDTVNIDIPFFRHGSPQAENVSIPLALNFLNVLGQTIAAHKDA